MHIRFNSKTVLLPIVTNEMLTNLHSQYGVEIELIYSFVGNSTVFLCTCLVKRPEDSLKLESHMQY